MIASSVHLLAAAIGGACFGIALADAADRCDAPRMSWTWIWLGFAVAAGNFLVAAGMI